MLQDWWRIRYVQRLTALSPSRYLRKSTQNESTTIKSNAPVSSLIDLTFLYSGLLYQFLTCSSEGNWKITVRALSWCPSSTSTAVPPKRYLPPNWASESSDAETYCWNLAGSVMVEWTIRNAGIDLITLSSGSIRLTWYLIQQSVANIFTGACAYQPFLKIESGCTSLFIYCLRLCRTFLAKKLYLNLHYYIIYITILTKHYCTVCKIREPLVINL